MTAVSNYKNIVTVKCSYPLLNNIGNACNFDNLHTSLVATYFYQGLMEAGGGHAEYRLLTCHHQHGALDLLDVVTDVGAPAREGSFMLM